MILVDSSVWIEHLGRRCVRLAELLGEGRVLCHPFVIGELACGNLDNRREILDLLATLPQARMAEHHELLRFLDRYALAGRGLGWVDVHLLASAMLSACALWTDDKALRGAARDLGVQAAMGASR